MQIGFETGARDALRMKLERKWLEQGFDAVTFNRDDIVSGWPAPETRDDQLQTLY